MIVKVQRPLNTDEGPALIYDQKREHRHAVSKSQSLLDALVGNPKAYFEAELVDGKFALKSRVADRSW